MQDQRSEEEPSEACLSENQTEKAVMELLLVDRQPWAREEIAREISGSDLDAMDAVMRLEGAGLVHRLGEFVFPSRAARRADEINLSH